MAPSARGRHRWSAWIGGLLVLAALPAVAGYVLLTSPDAAPDAEAALVERLAADGEPADVIECVLRLGGRDLRTGGLGETARTELVTGCRVARDALLEPTDYDPPASLADVDLGPQTLGDDPALDALWLACQEGSGAACDELFEVSPIGTAYEAYGLSCGERPEVLDCIELDRPTDGEPAGTEGSEPAGTEGTEPAGAAATTDPSAGPAEPATQPGGGLG